MKKKKSYRITHSPPIYIVEDDRGFNVIDERKKMLAVFTDENISRLFAVEHARKYFKSPVNYKRTWQKKLDSLYRIQRGI